LAKREVVTKSVSLGELTGFPRTKAALELTENAERTASRRFVFSALHKGFAVSPLNTRTSLFWERILGVGREP
jgi:hypothetical protein